MIPQCPACHQKTALAGNTVYCPDCGWNRDVAIFSLQKSLNLLPIAILMVAGFAAFLYWGLKLNRTPMLMIFPSVPALAIPLNFLFLRRKLAEFKGNAGGCAELAASFELQCRGESCALGRANLSGQRAR